MTPRIADDFPDIKARMEQIAQERGDPKGNETGGIESEPAQQLPYMGWDIYAPVNL